MPQRVFSAALFVVGLVVLGLSFFTLFFGLTGLGQPLAIGMALFGFALCAAGFFFLADSPDGGRSGLQWRAYCVGLFLAGLTQLITSILIIFFAFTAVDTPIALLGAGAGVLLCVAGSVLLAAPTPRPRDLDPLE